MENRCDDDKEVATDRLEAAGKSIIEKYLTSSSPKDLSGVLGGRWEGGQGVPELELREVGCFESLSEDLINAFEKGCNEVRGTAVQQ